MTDQPPQPMSPDPTLPDSLCEDLAKLTETRIFVSEEIDHAVLAEAQQKIDSFSNINGADEVHGAADSTKRFRIWPWYAGGAAAAVVLIAIMHNAFEPGDVDRNGQVDILDCFAMAKHIQADRPVPGHWDFNRDGQIDQIDVDELAGRVVQLNGTTEETEGPGEPN